MRYFFKHTQCKGERHITKEISGAEIQAASKLWFDRLSRCKNEYILHILSNTLMQLSNCSIVDGTNHRKYCKAKILNIGDTLSNISRLRIIYLFHKCIHINISISKGPI